MAARVENYFRGSLAPQTMLKHEILKGYLAKFAASTGTNSPGNRVGFIDGYAGAGEYLHEATGTRAKGSPLIAIQEMRHQLLITPPRHLECVFVEKDQAHFTALSAHVAAAVAEGLPARARQGDVSDHLPEALNSFAGLPVLVFLDPFGASLAHDASIPTILNRADPAPTELLLNFSVETLRRAGARIHEAEGTPGRDATLRRMDSWLGGPWWREFFLDPALSETSDGAHLAAERITDEYALRVKSFTGCGVFPVEVRRASGHKPLFRLMLFYPRSIAAYKYNDAVSLAQEKWRAALWDVDIKLAEKELYNNPSLGDAHLAMTVTAAAVDKLQFKQDTIETMRTNLLTVLESKSAVSVRNNFGEIFGSVAGVARELHLRAAWDLLAAEGVVLPRDKSVRQLDRAVITRRGAFAPSFAEERRR